MVKLAETSAKRMWRKLTGSLVGRTSLAALLALIGAVHTAQAEEFEWQGTTNNVLSLAEPSSYKVSGVVATRLPGAADSVTMKVDSYAEVDNDTINTLNGVSGVRLLSRSRIVFNVTTNAHVTVPVSSFNVSAGTLSALGTIEKNCTSELSFDSISDVYLYSKQHVDYFCERLKVNAGTVLVNNTYDERYKTQVFMIGTVEVAEGATFFLPQPCYCYIRGLAGAGLVTNDCTLSAVERVRIQSGPSTFSGVLASRTKLESFTVVGNLKLLGTDSMIDMNKFCVDAPSNGEGYAGIASFGYNTSTPSAIGTSLIQLTASAGTPHLEYLGSGDEATRKTLYIFGGSGHPSIVDGGPNGGVTFEQPWYGGTALASFGGINLVLTGSNTTEMTHSHAIRDCVLSNSKEAANEWYNQVRPLSITKRGTGCWNLGDFPRPFSGIVAVEEGTLRFSSLAARGTECSLGVATNCYESKTSTSHEPFTKKDYADGTPVGYAIRLGDPNDINKTGTLEYYGSAAVGCTTRPIAVTGSGRLLSTGGTFDFSGVSPFNAGENVLTLDGTRADSILRDVTNNVGGLSIVKKGGGTWTLLGDQTFSGDVSVEEGTLKMGGAYTWFRLNFHQNNTNSASWNTNYKKHVRAREFGLFDDSGARCNTGLVYVAKTTKSTLLTNIDLNPGETDYCYKPGALHDGAASGSATSYQTHDPAKLFDGQSNTYYYAPAAGNMTDESNQNTWLRIEFRLAEGVGEATSLDLLPDNYASDNDAFAPTAWSVEGSVDGQTWTTLFATNGLAPADYNASQWFSNGDSFSASGTHTGFRFKTFTDGMNIAPSLRSIHVAPNAVLSLEGSASATVNKLVVDVAGMGTVKGLKLASTGTVDLVGDFTETSFTIPADLSGLDGFDALASGGWTFTHDGGSMRNYSAHATAAGFAVVRKGLSVVIR